MGLISSLMFVFERSKVENIKSYSETLKELDNYSKNSREIVLLMSKCSLVDLIKTFFICYRDYVKFNNSLNFNEQLRLLFKLFIVINCQMKFVRWELLKWIFIENFSYVYICFV